MCQYSGTIHYTVKDGLPSSATYYTIQDRKGFIWISTDAGLAMFDGTKFKVFTTADGIPDNEVLGLHFDAKTDRIWIISYCKQACYYRDGKFFTTKTDSSLGIIKCDFGEFLNANVQNNNVEFLFNASSVYEYSDNKAKKMTTNGPVVEQVKKWNDSVYDVLTQEGMIEFKNGITVKKYDIHAEKGKWIDSIFVAYHVGALYLYDKQATGDYHLRNKISLFDKSQSAGDIILVNGKFIISQWEKGLYSIDSTLDTPLKLIWPGSLSGFNRDKNDNIWITTTDDGVYVLKKQNAINYNSDNGLIHDNVTSIYCGRDDQILYLGNSFGEVFSVNEKGLKSLNIGYGKSIEKIRGITGSGDNLFFISNYLVSGYNKRYNKQTYIPHSAGGPKSILLLRDSNTILVGLVSAILEYRISDGRYKEIEFSKRLIALAEHPDGRVFCGSLDGLYEYSNEKLIHVVNSDSRLQSRITSLCFSPDSILWIGTPSNGVMAYDGNKVIGHITTDKYPAYIGAICRKVTAGKPNEIWVATNSGIDMIRYHKQDSIVIDNITPLNTNDGLLSDDVNDILANDSLIYVATSHGLTILNENELANPSPAPIYISSVRINDADSLIHEGEYNLSYRQNNLKIEYIGVILPSAGYIRYQYRLLGSGNDKWVTTTNTSIEFRSLSFGNYVFEVVVLDKFGNRSKQIARVKFKVRKAFYMTFWFWSVIIVLILTSGFYVIRYRFRRQQAIKSKIIDLEQQALKAQMNPHFIFNCLTAIQHFVNKEDVYSANMYLSNFAKLIRKTLDLSGEQYITLDKEVAYLDNYIQLEKMRFQDQFNYSIKVDADVDSYTALVPPMLLQPIIENAIRHGLRYKDNNNGLLNISFARQDNIIICSIDDNGIGIKRSKELKTKAHVEYQSKGMKLTESRIAAINMISSRKITMEVKDKYDDTGNPIGTLVVIKFEQ